MRMQPVFFDAVEELLRKLVDEQREELRGVERIVAIRDLFGRVRFVLDQRPEGELAAALHRFAEKTMEGLGPRAYPADQAFLYREELAFNFDNESCGQLLDDKEPKIFLVDRQITGQGWATVSPLPQEGASTISAPRRLAFYSLKGGVGRSTAAAVVAWHLAKNNRSVLVLDLDLEAPGLSTSLLPQDRQPERGVVDWFVEDAVGQGKAVLERMVSDSPLARDLPGQIWVVPSHGAEPGDYLAKLGRCYLDLPPRNGLSRESWRQRLVRLVNELESHKQPDVVLLDVRAGLEDLSSVPVTDLAAEVVLFASDTDQTWAGYELLFDYWQRTEAIRTLRERLHVVAALVPETYRNDYLDGFRQQAWDLFRDHAYDEIAPSEGEAQDSVLFSFDLADESAPHAPIPIYWNRGLANIANLQTLDETLVAASFGSFLDRIDDLVAFDEENG